MLKSFFVTLSVAVLLAGCATVGSTNLTLPGTQYSKQDQSCLSEALYHEARGTVDKGLRAVGEVILNRAADPRFPDSICGVIDQRYNGACQFSYRCDSIPNGVFNEPNEKSRTLAMALTLLTDRQEDITNGALFFHAASMNPGWFNTLSPRGQFGGNIFYR